jgi:predicted nucleic acid binding AN1-type Zn finger protein
MASRHTFCSFSENTNEICKMKVIKLVGFCKYCEKNFCNKHRLPESHKCEKLEIMKNNQRSNLEMRLNNEKMIGSKIEKI